ncbi:hypothetical protein DDN72_17640 [Vibrio cholerae]|nr:hypothetical protein [Vibrio cholerae]
MFKVLNIVMLLIARSPFYSFILFAYIGFAKGYMQVIPYIVGYAIVYVIVMNVRKQEGSN